jgi:outer membrane immunogenic protein
MKRFLFSAALIGLGAAPAFAADLPAKAPMAAPVVAPAWSWTGFYIGAHGGGVWGRDEITHSAIIAPAGLAFPVDAAALTAGSSPLLNVNGWVAGVHAGYNVQTGSLVWGVEGDFSYFRLRANSAGTFPFPSTLAGGPLGPPTLTFTANTATSSDWLATIRPRLGFAAGNALFYATGGLAVTNEKVSQSNMVDSLGTVLAGSISETRFGWTAGGGIEYMLTPNWTIRAEYLHLDFGTTNGAGVVNVPTGVLGNLQCTAGAPVLTGPATYTGCSISSRLTAELVKVGISYKFGGSDAVVARY